MADATFSIPRAFACRITEVHGAAGDAWLGRLPTIVTDCARRWSLRLDAPFQPLSYNYVAPVTRADGTPAVLKVGLPDPALRREAGALRLFDGRGAARLLAADLDRGALLLERLEPGEPLSALRADEAATTIAAQVMRQLWRPAPAEHAFPSVADWAAGLGDLRQRFGGTSGLLPPALVDEAEALFADLIASMGEPVLLHGDLHHDNILTAGRHPWLAIDPKGLT
jgi:streptomycin 6-kinase